MLPELHFEAVTVEGMPAKLRAENERPKSLQDSPARIKNDLETDGTSGIATVNLQVNFLR
jgi:hypothetical protein